MTDIAISTQANWWGQAAGDREAGELLDNLGSKVSSIKEIVEESPVDPKDKGDYRYRYSSTTSEGGDYEARYFVLEVNLENEEIYKIDSASF